MNIPTDLLYTKTHEWVKKMENGKVRVGLTDHAQHALGDLVFVNLPQEDDSFSAGESFAEVESVKAVFDVFCPVSGTVCAINEELLDAPERINQAPYDAWPVSYTHLCQKSTGLPHRHNANLPGRDSGWSR